MKKHIQRQDENFETFNQLVMAAAETYTLSLKSACKALKCSRSWANNYIRPYVPAIYVSNGRLTDPKGNVIKKTNYAYILSIMVNEIRVDGETDPSNESIYLDKQKFNEYVKSRIVKCQKRSKKVPKTYFIAEEKLKEYYLELFKNLFSNKVDEQDLTKIFLSYVDDDIRSTIEKNIVLPTKRTKAEWVDVKLPEADIKDWKAVHDLMDYGDVEETIYRELFRNGSIRIELMFPDKEGTLKSKGKVYYIDDPNPIIIPEERKKLEEESLKWALKEMKKSIAKDKSYEKNMERLAKIKKYIQSKNAICIQEKLWKALYVR